jgi:DNA-binding NtrC family response regulator
MLEAISIEAPRPTMPAASETGPICIDDRLRDYETALIRWALRITGGNKSKAAQLLKIKRSTLGDRINRCGLGNGHADDIDLYAKGA